MDEQPPVRDLQALSIIIGLASVVMVLAANVALVVSGAWIGLGLLAPLGLLHAVAVVAHIRGDLGLRNVTVVAGLEVALGLALIFGLSTVGGPCCGQASPWEGTTPALILVVVGLTQLAASGIEATARRGWRGSQH